MVVGRAPPGEAVRIPHNRRNLRRNVEAWPSSKLMHSPNTIRAGRRRHAAVLRQSALRRDHPPVLGPPGCRAARHDPDRLHRGAGGRRGLLRPPARAVRREQEHHDLRPLLAGPGRDHEAHGHRGDLPRRLGDLGQGLHQRGPRPRPGQLPAEPGARRGRRAGARPSHRRPQSAVPASAHDRTSSAPRPRPSTTVRSSSPTPTPATAEIRTCAT